MFLVPLKRAAKQPKSTPTKQPKSDKQHKSSKTAANQLYILTQTKRKIWKHLIRDREVNNCRGILTKHK